LHFLHFLLAHSSLSLSVDQVNLLWDLTVTQAIDAEEREMVFAWLKNAESSEATDSNQNNSNHVGSRGVSPFSEDLMEHLFTKKIREMDMKNLG
jgi:hypothetical protein